MKFLRDILLIGTGLNCGLFLFGVSNGDSVGVFIALLSGIFCAGGAGFCRAKTEE